MKTASKIGMFIALIICFASFAVGQNVLQQDRPEAAWQADRANTISGLNGFRAGLHWQWFVPSGQGDKTAAAFTYHIDTAIVYSASSNPSRYIYTYDSAGNKILSRREALNNDTWTPVSKDSTVYDSVGNPLTILSKKWLDGVWENVSLYINTFTTNHNLVSKVGKIWSDNQWVPTDSTFYTYNFDGKKAAYYRAEWDGVSWKNNGFQLYSYDSVGNLKLILFEKWRDSVWVDSQRILFSYDSVSNLTQGLIQDWGDTSWVNLYEEDYSYDSLKNRISYVGKNWNDSIWVNDQQYHYAYNKYGWLVTGVGETWMDSVWVNVEKGQYTYDDYGGLESYWYQQWKNDSVWENISLSQYSYDSVGNAYQGMFYTWNSIDGNWLQNQDGLLQIYYNYASEKAFFTGYQVDIKYNSPLSTQVEGVHNVVSKFFLAPNPATDYTSITLQLKEPQQVNVRLFNITGKKVSELFLGKLNRGLHRFRFSTVQLPPGLYFVSLVSADQVQTVKLIVKK